MSDKDKVERIKWILENTAPVSDEFRIEEIKKVMAA